MPKTNEIHSSKSEFQEKEHHLKRKFPDLKSSVELFKDDELCFKPGTTYYYTTHGFTLLSAVIEEATGQKFPVLARRLFTKLGMESTYLDEASPLIYNRACQYCKQNGRLINAPYVDCSYKWAGGGFLSSVTDIAKFGNIMLYSSQYGTSSDSRNSGDQFLTGSDSRNNGYENSYKYSSPKNSIIDGNQVEEKSFAGPTDYHNQMANDIRLGHSNNLVNPNQQGHHRGYLTAETMALLWHPVSQQKQRGSWDRHSGWYGMGWDVRPAIHSHGNQARERLFSVGHTGGAIGGSSSLLIVPKQTHTKTTTVNQNLISKNKKDSVNESISISSGNKTCSTELVTSDGGSSVDRPAGVVVAILFNIQGVNLEPVAQKIARVFM